MAAAYVEYTLTATNGMVGTLCLPVAPSADTADTTTTTTSTASAVPTYPAVLMLHGFGSQRHEVADMYASAAHALASNTARPIASLRVDFHGFGESSGSTADHTVTRQNADALFALDWLREKSLSVAHGVQLDTARIGVLGYSFGGAAAMELVAARRADVQSLVTWSTVGDYGRDFRGRWTTSGNGGDPSFNRALAEEERERVTVYNLGYRTIELKGAFFQSLVNGANLVEKLRGFRGKPYLGIFGSDDVEAVRHVDALLGAALDPTPVEGESERAPKDVEEQSVGVSGRTPSGRVLVIDGADHIFHVFEGAKSSAERVIQETVAHFAASL